MKGFPASKMTGCTKVLGQGPVQLPCARKSEPLGVSLGLQNHGG